MIKIHIKYIVLIIVFGFVIYANSLNNSFIWEDHKHIENNDFIKDFSNLPDLFNKNYFNFSKETQGISYRPITTLSYFINYKLWKLNPFGYYLSNILNHIFNALLVYFLAYFLFANKKVAFLSGLFFVSYPNHVEAVSCITFNENLLACMFLLLSFYLYVKIEERKEKRGKSLLCLRVLSNFFYLFALFSKEVSIVLPLIIISYDYCFLPEQKKNKFIKRMISSYSGYILITIFYLWVRVCFLQDITGSIFNCSFKENQIYFDVLKMVAFSFYYIKLLVFPVNLCSYYALHVPVSLTDPVFLLGIVVNTVVVLFGVGLYRYTTKKIFWCFLWIFLNLFPMIILLPFRHFFSSRYLYIPSVGGCLLLAIGFNYILVSLKSSLMKNLVKIFLIFILVGYSFRVIKENFNRRDALTRDLILCKRYPDNFRLRFDLGWDYQCKGLYDDAVREYKKSLQLNPYFESARINLGNIYMKKTLYNQAIKEYRKVLRLVTDNADIHNNLGLCYVRIKLYDRAVEEYELAIKINSEFVAPYKNLGTLYALQGLYNEAIEKYKKSLELDPAAIKIRINLGYIYSVEGKDTLAMNKYKEVLKLDPENIFVQEELRKLKKENMPYNKLLTAD